MARPYKRVTASGGVSWYIRWADETGARQTETFKSEAAAKAALRRREVEVDDIRSGRARPKSKQTIAEAAQRWLAERPLKRLRNDQSILNAHILPFLGSKTLSEVSVETSLQARFIRHLEGKVTSRPGEHGPRGKGGVALAPGTVKNVLRCLTKLLGDSGYPTRIAYKVPERGYAWIEQKTDVGRFLAACRPEWFRLFSMVSLHCGLRKGEVAGLRVGAIDFAHELIRVERSYDAPTKSGKVRHAPLDPALAAELRAWIDAQGLEVDDLVITGPAGPIDELTDTAGLARRACARAGIPSVSFHQLRHTFASHLASERPINVVQAILGHSDPRVTMRYSHLNSESIARDPRNRVSFAVAGEQGES